MNTPVKYMILTGNENGAMRAIIPTTIVASARTVQRISPIASESSSFLTDSTAKKSSGTVVPSHTTSIPTTIELIHIDSAILRDELIMKCAQMRSTHILTRSMRKFFILSGDFAWNAAASELSSFNVR
jgi:hypothetical protein